MTEAMSRRTLLRSGLVASSALAIPGVATHRRSTQRPADEDGPTGERLRALERSHDARLGVWARNERTGQVLKYRSAERFAMCSTFKPVAAAAVLRDHQDRLPLEHRVFYPPADLLPYSPITENEHADGKTVAELCAAAIQYSDNTGGNLLLRMIGGPRGLTRFLRSLGDDISKLERWETELNSAVPGERRDTTTPAAIATTYASLMLGRALRPRDRQQLVEWMKGNTTSGQRFRAGLPESWVIADKTATGAYASAHDVGVVWTTRGTPLVLAVLSSKPAADAPVDNRLIAEATRVVARELAPDE